MITEHIFQKTETPTKHATHNLFLPLSAAQLIAAHMLRKFSLGIRSISIGIILRSKRQRLNYNSLKASMLFPQNAEDIIIVAFSFYPKLICILCKCFNFSNIDNTAPYS